MIAIYIIGGFLFLVLIACVILSIGAGMAEEEFDETKDIEINNKKSNNHYE